MNMPMDEIAFTFALVELVKKVDDEGKLKKWYPLFSLGFGILVSLGLTYLTGQVSGESLINGLLYGLSASGFYSAVKK